MRVSEIMTSAIISARPDDPVSTALSHMTQHGISQILITTDDSLNGMVELKTVITKNIDPVNTKVHSLCKKVPIISPDADVMDAIPILLHSGLKALPVVSNNKVVGIVSETDFMKLVMSPQKVSTLMSECAYVAKNALVGDVKKLMTDHNISRVPVVDGMNVLGVVRTLDLARIQQAKPIEGTGRGLKNRGTREKVRAEQYPIKNFITPTAVVSKDQDIRSIAELLQKHHEVFVVDDGKFFVVTPKDVLESEFLKQEEGIRAQFSNLGHEDPFVAYQLEEEVRSFTDKMKQELPGLLSVIFRLERIYHGGKVKYSIHARVYSSAGMAVAKSWGWDPLAATQDVIKKLEREAVGKKEKIHDRGERIRRNTKRR